MNRASRVALAWAAIAIGGVLAACTPYRIDIQQGNFVTQDMVQQLKPGMSKEQVRFILGTPLLADIFHNDRWDYAYYRELPKGEREQRKLTVYFEDGKLTRLGGDITPAAAPQEAK